MSKQPQSMGWLSLTCIFFAIAQELEPPWPAMDSHNKEEWRELTRPLWPEDWDDSDYDNAWDDFIRNVKSN